LHAPDLFAIGNRLSDQKFVFAGGKDFRGGIFLEIGEPLAELLLIVNKRTLKGRTGQTLGTGAEK
jgi:hypothetical protein